MFQHPRTSARERGYTWEWQKARKAYLDAHPLCVMCQRMGRVSAAQVVDHITPHKGNKALFWDQSNWQALDFNCHNSLKQQEDIHGFNSEIGSDGWPTDPKHPANRKRRGG